MTSGVARTIEDGRDELSAEEAQEFLEDQVQHYLGMNLAEFMRRAEEGSLPEHPAVGHLVLLTGARPGPC